MYVFNTNFPGLNKHTLLCLGDKSAKYFLDWITERRKKCKSATCQKKIGGKPQVTQTFPVSTTEPIVLFLY